MALIRSLNTAVSGLKAQQQRIEIVGNNIANVDTTAFKATRAEFSTILSQLQSYGMAPDGFLGGIDPTQVGLGTYLGGTPKDMNQGPIQATGVASDLAINGDGFFILRDASGKEVFTRDGSFSINPANMLHDAATGYVVQGYMADENFQVTPGGTLSDIEIPIGVKTIAKSTSEVTMEGNLNSSGPVASSGTHMYSEALYDASRPNSEPISALNPLGLERATADSRLQDLVRSLGDYTAFSTSSVGSAATSAYLFPELQTNPVGLKIDLAGLKGDRDLPSASFVVGDPPPTGGTTLGDFVSFIQGTLGIADGTFDGSEKTEATYSFARINPVTGEEINGTIGPLDSASVTSMTDLGADFRGVQAGDFFRVISGASAGQFAQIESVSDSNAYGIPDTLVFRNDGFNSLKQLVEGDAYAVQAPAGVGISTEKDLTTFTGLTPSAVSTSGQISSFTFTDPSATDLTVEKGIQVNQVVEYASGGSTVRGVVSGVSGNTVTVAFDSSLSQAPDAGTDFAIKVPQDGTIEVAGNVGSANQLSNLDVTAGGKLTPLFDTGPVADAVGESLSTTVLAYDSLGTPREVTLTFVYQSSSANGPNVFRWFAESADDSDRNRVVGSGTVLFNSSGQFVSNGPEGDEISIDLAANRLQSGGVVSPLKFRLDFSRLTQFSDGSQVVMRDQDGFRTGTLRDFAVSEDGIIQGVFDNGLTRTLGQVALARFANPNGMVDRGNNYCEASVNSGISQIGTPGTFGRGMVRGGFLEESNVDLAAQFTQLIIGQRAFQANAKTITTSDQLLQELVNLL